jgi:predicted dehydrogenase
MNVAVAGLGFMGATHLKAWKQVSRARVTAVVSSDERKLTGDLTAVGGNLGGTVEVMDFSDIRKYRTLEEALSDPGVDAVDLCLPTDQHGTAAIAALRAGKHVLVEKPMAMDEAEADIILKEAGRTGRTLMVGQVLRFFPAYVALADTLPASPVRSAVFRRRCGAPTWNRWLKDSSRSGGGAFDLLIHDVDYCISRWGIPEAVRASGHEDLARGIDIVHAELRYREAGAVIVTGGWHPGAYPFSMGFTVVTDRSTLEWSSGEADLLEYVADEGDVGIRRLPDSDPFADELQYFTDCAVDGRKPEKCMPEQSAQAVALMRRIIESRNRNGEIIPCHN